MKNPKIKKMVTMSLLVAIIIVLQMTAGMLPTLPGGAKLSFVLIPIVLGAALYGSGAGAFLGAVFGLIVFYYSASGTDAVGFAIFQENAIGCFLICVGKSLAAGFLAGLVYRSLSKINQYVAMLCASIVCPVVNTGIFMGSVALFFHGTTFGTTPETQTAIVSIFSIILLFNAIPELIINIVFSPAGQRIVKVVKK